MNKLGFGTMRLPLIDENDQTSVDLEQFIKMVDLFMDKGFNYFDTAYIYHGGESEKALKKALVDKYPRESYVLFDKLPLFFIHKNEDIKPLFNEQFDRLGVDYIDYYLLHNVCTWNEYSFKDADTFEFAIKAKEEGKIKKLGISFHEEADYFEEMLKNHPEIDFVMLQINYLDWLDKNIQSKRLYDLARQYDKEILIMEPLKGGSLANVPPEVLEIMKNHDKDETPISWALRFCGSLEGVKVVFSGASSFEQLDENTDIFIDFKPLNDEDKQMLEEVTDIIRSNIAIDCTSCNYCLDSCPEDIPIAKYFEMYNAEEQMSWTNDLTQLNCYLQQINKSKSPEDCSECNKCIEHCPQHLDIPKYLKQVHEKFDKEARDTDEMLS